MEQSSSHLSSDKARRFHSAPRRDCEHVISLVALKLGVPTRLFTSNSRCRSSTARARQLAMYLCHTALGQTMQDVGVTFHRDRTTVSYACSLIEDLREDPSFDAEVNALEAAIERRMYHA